MLNRQNQIARTKQASACLIACAHVDTRLSPARTCCVLAFLGLKSCDQDVCNPHLRILCAKEPRTGSQGSGTQNAQMWVANILITTLETQEGKHA